MRQSPVVDLRATALGSETCVGEGSDVVDLGHEEVVREQQELWEGSDATEEPIQEKRLERARDGDGGVHDAESVAPSANTDVGADADADVGADAGNFGSAATETAVGEAVRAVSDGIGHVLIPTLCC